MTPIALLNQLKTFIEKNTKDIILEVRPVRLKTTHDYQEHDIKEITNRSADIYIQNLPDKEAEIQRIPYILIKFLTGKDSQSPGENPESECKIRIIAVTYSEDRSKGAVDALNVITRIRIALLEAGQVGQFLLRQPLEYIVYEEEINPYYIAEMVTIFELPEIYLERKGNLYA